MMGRVQEADVSYLVTGTRAPSRKVFGRLLQTYSGLYWRANPRLARQIARRLWARKQTIQPRLLGKNAPNIADGHWVTEEEFW
jgi:hypothetical protein